MALFAVRRVRLPLCAYSSADTAGRAQRAGQVGTENVVDLSVPVKEAKLVVDKAELADGPRDEFAAHLRADHERSVQLAATDSAPGCAQREVRRMVKGWGLSQIADVVELLALELVRVAMGGSGQHAAWPPRYRELLRAGWLGLRFQLEAYGLVIATWDQDPRPPQFRQPGTGPAADSRALYYVPMLAEAWDFFRSGTGKVVWAEVRIPSAGEGWLPRRGRTSVRRPTAPFVRDIKLLERVRDGLRRLPDISDVP